MSAADNNDADTGVTMPQGMDADVWATMTQEEREGIAASDYTSDELATMQKLAGGTGSDDDGDDDDDASDDDKGGADDAAAAKAGDGSAGDRSDDGQGADKPASADQAASDQPVTPRYEAKLPDDFNDRVTSLETAHSEAWQKFNDGDLDQAGLQAELSRIANERMELNRLQTKAEVSQEMTAQTAAQQWESAVKRSIVEFSKPENGGIDYRKDEAKMADLDQFVKVLANNEANNDKPMEWFLQEAHKRVQALHGIQSAKPKETPAEANNSRKPNLDAAPKSLAQVPGGDGPGDVGGEFADIDQLDGEELESAIGRMTPAQRERYAKAG